jgi:hypothetical protein
VATKALERSIQAALFPVVVGENRPVNTATDGSNIISHVHRDGGNIGREIFGLDLA